MTSCQSGPESAKSKNPCDVVADSSPGDKWIVEDVNFDPFWKANVSVITGSFDIHTWLISFTDIVKNDQNTPEGNVGNLRLSSYINKNVPDKKKWTSDFLWTLGTLLNDQMVDICKVLKVHSQSILMRVIMKPAMPLWVIGMMVRSVFVKVDVHWLGDWELTAPPFLHVGSDDSCLLLLLAEHIVNTFGFQMIESPAESVKLRQSSVDVLAKLHIWIFNKSTGSERERVP